MKTKRKHKPSFFAVKIKMYINNKAKKNIEYFFKLFILFKNLIIIIILYTKIQSKKYTKNKQKYTQIKHSYLN